MNASPVSLSVRRLPSALRSAAVVCVLPLAAHAQLQWSVFNETTTTAAPAATVSSGVAVPVAAGQRVTLVANNLVPIDLTANGTEAYVTISFKVSGGLSGIAAGTRAIGYGLFNNKGTPTDYSDDAGYFTWLNGRNTGSLIEQRRRIGDGSNPSLLWASGTAVTNMSTGQSSPTPGSLNDGNVYSLTLHLMSRGGAISFGNTSSNVTGGGIILDGPGIRAITFSNPDAPASAFVFNEIGFMFLNTTAATQTLTITGVSSSNGAFQAINPPAITAQPPATSLNPGQAGSLTVSATGTLPLTYQWRRDGAAIAGATSATLNVASAATADAGSYSVVITNAYGTVTSSAAALTVTATPIPPTITRQPASATVNVGDNLTLSVAAFGSSPVFYQWRKDGANVVGATNATLVLSNITTASAGSYTVVVSNQIAVLPPTISNIATSAAATLAVNTAPAITTQPVGVMTSVGQSVTFSVAATGTPAPIYQWARNGTALAGATNSTLTVANVQLADAGVYTVALINDVGGITSAPAVLAIPSTMAVTATAPATNASAANTDVPLSLTFDRAPVAGRTGRIRIFKASDDTVVDTLDLGASLQQRTVGTNATLYNFLPVAITGNTATFYMRATLAYGTTYYAQIEPSAILDSTGASFTGISDKTTWRFTTKAASTAREAAITVAADGSADFNTVQGAIDSVPAGNTSRVVITVKKGTYNEIVYLGATRPFVTIRGEDRAQTIVGYANNNNLNGTTATRAAFSIAANDTILESITIRNPTPQGGSQAEAVFTGALRVMLNRVNLLSRQDTLLTNTGTAFITDSYIEGNVDFMWGTAAAYYQRCELKALDVGTGTVGFYTQIRNGATGFGAVYVDCKLTAADGVAGRVQYFLGRIDPGAANFPYSQNIYLNCAMGPHIDPAGWRLDNATTSSTIQYWEYKSTDLSGASLDITRRHVSSRQLGDAEAALWRNPAFVLSGWNPSVAAAIESSPASQSATAGSNVRLTVTANGAPQPAFQWFKGGVAIPGATDATLLLANVQPADAGSYTVTTSNAGASVTSAAAAVTVTRGAYAGVYFGTFKYSVDNSTNGSFALYVRDNGTGVLLATIIPPGTFASRSVTVDAAGRFRVTEERLILEGAIDATGRITGSLSAPAGGVGGSGLTYSPSTLTGARASTTGTTQAYAGYFLTGANNAAANASIIASADGRAFAFVQTVGNPSAGTGTVDAAGRVAVSFGNDWSFAGTIAAGGASANGTITPVAGGPIATAGAGDSPAGAPRFREFAARSMVSPTSATSVGFTITGDAPNSVLIRAIGPTLGDAFAVAGSLANPRLDIYRGSTLIATNTGWTTSPTATDAAFAASQVGAFPLRATNADSALRLSLLPGPYTAVVSSANGTTSGASLVEVYDVTNGAAGQRLVNLSVSGLAGTGTNGLVAGVVVTGTQPKRILIRAAGPALSALGVAAPLARPILSLYRGTALIASNAGWASNPDATGSDIAAAAAAVQAFPFAPLSADSAILINLLPGLYSAIVSSPDATTGTALIEVYEVP
ncbi:MAG: immunoglobulin domain-containing protein [Verrucomicrobia bacterium]|nr:immunoglobulin domain-containing protein [Verrucomicrobiota bacterium]